MNDVGTCESGPGVDTRRLVHIDMCLRVKQALVHSGKHIDLLTSEQVLVHGGQDRDRSVPLFGQEEHFITRYYLAPGVTFIHDVGFIIHTTKAVLLRVKVLDFVHIDTNTGYGM